MVDIDNLVNQNVSEYEKFAPMMKDYKKQERLEKLEKQKKLEQEEKEKAEQQKKREEERRDELKEIN